MEQSDKLEIGPSLGDIDRGLEVGAPKRILYQELSQIADKLRNKDNVVSNTVKEGLKRAGEKIHKEGR